MAVYRLLGVALSAAAALALSACTGSGDGAGSSDRNSAPAEEEEGSTLWELFDQSGNPDVAFQVNRYIWNASLDVLDFLPLDTVDPFTGVISTGWGRPPGGRADYRATILIRDPALDARSLNVALYTRSGPADADTVEAIEDAILTRARQLRNSDSKL